MWVSGKCQICPPTQKGIVTGTETPATEQNINHIKRPASKVIAKLKDIEENNYVSIV